MVKRLILLLLIGITLMAGGCGNEQSAFSAHPANYELVPVKTDSSRWGADLVAYKGNLLYYISEAETQYLIIQVTGDNGKESTLFAIDKQPDMIGFGGLCVTDNQSVWYHKIVKTDNQIQHILVLADSQGKEIAATPIDEAASGTTGIRQMILDGDGNLYLLTTKKLYAFSSDGTPAFTYNMRVPVEALLCSSKGQLLLYSKGPVVSAFSFSDQKITKQYQPKMPFITSMYSGFGPYDVLVMESRRWLMGITLASMETELLIDFSGAGIDSMSLTGFTHSEDLTFWTMERGQSVGGGSSPLFLLQPTEDKRTIITCGGVYLSPIISQLCRDFNNQNDQYKIVQTDYAKLESLVLEDALRSDPAQAFNLALAAGHVPDLFVSSGYTDLANLYKKGVLEDLYPYIDADADMQRSDFFPNIQKACEQDGALIQLLPAFDSMTAVGKQEIFVGLQNDLNYEKLAELSAKAGVQGAPYSDLSQQSALYYSLLFCWNDLLGTTKDKLVLDSGMLADILAWCKTFPASAAADSGDFDRVMPGIGEDLMSNESVLLNAYINTVRSLRYPAEFFGAPVTPVGFPGAAGSQSIIMPVDAFAISRTSDNKDGAWEFIRFVVLHSNNQYAADHIPNDVALFEQMCLDELVSLEAREDKAYNRTDMLGYYTLSYTYWPDQLSGSSKNFAITQAEIDELTAFITSLDQLGGMDTVLRIEIVNTAQDYLQGSATLENTVRALESKINLYIAEKS